MLDFAKVAFELALGSNSQSHFTYQAFSTNRSLQQVTRFLRLRFHDVACSIITRYGRLKMKIGIQIQQLHCSPQDIMTNKINKGNI